ncbi:GrpB family protein [Bacillus licheniformis]|nr:GrpB family protein [Bacillus licheniformis]
MHIHHIGSTSIPGMSAKPIIDILIEVKDLGSAAGFEKGMKMLGYEPKGENGIPGRRFYQKGDGSVHTMSICMKAGIPISDGISRFGII